MNLIINMVIAITATAAGILVLKIVFWNKLSPKLNYYLWAILVIRILFIIFPQSYLTTYSILPMIENVEKSEPVIENIKVGTINEQSSQITGNIVFHNFSKPFSINGKIELYSTFLWLIVAAAFLFHLLIIYILFKAKLRKITTCNDENLLILISEYKEKLGIRMDISIKKYGSTPMLVGMLKPILVLPEVFEDKEARQMIVHELCHLKHHDILLNMVSTAFLCLNWFNPIIWLCWSMFRSDLEMLCDQKVLEMTSNKKEYASLLLKTSLKSTSLPLTTCMNNGKNEIKRRIGYMANFRKPNIIWTTMITMSIALLTIGCLSIGVKSTDSNKWAPPIKGLEWGMSKAEVLDRLNLSNDDIEQPSDTMFIPYKNYELFGAEMTVAFIFQVPITSEGGVMPGDALITMEIMVKEEDIEVVEKEMVKKLGESTFYGYDSDQSVTGILWESPKISDQQEHINILKTVLDSWDPQSIGESYIDRPLVSYSYSRMYGDLTIHGGSAAMIEQPEKFTLINKD